MLLQQESSRISENKKNNGYPALKDNGFHWPLRCHGIGQSLPGKAQEWCVVSIVTTHTRAVKAGFLTSFLSFLQEKARHLDSESSFGQNNVVIFIVKLQQRSLYWRRRRQPLIANRPWSPRQLN